MLLVNMLPKFKALNLNSHAMVYSLTSMAQTRKKFKPSVV